MTSVIDDYLFIALKTKDDKYIVNGYNRASEGGFFEYNDDIFDYNKEASMIKARGPLNNPIVLMVGRKIFQEIKNKI